MIESYYLGEFLFLVIQKTVILNKKSKKKADMRYSSCAGWNLVNSLFGGGMGGVRELERESFSFTCQQGVVDAVMSK